MNQAVIIPTLNPSHLLITLTDELLRMDGIQVIVINDGSTASCEPIFETLRTRERVTVLTHHVNKGKGAALKTAFTYCLAQSKPLSGVITADDDGQHSAADIQRVAEALKQHPDRLVLGSRTFARDTTPTRSLIGNTVINHLIRFLYRLHINDSQTGLRGIPFGALPWMACLRGDHYEFEINMLIQAARRNLTILEIPIQLLYFDKNKASHYNTFRDTLRIARLLCTCLFGRPWPYGIIFCFTRLVLQLTHRHIKPPHYCPDDASVFIARHRNLKGVFDIILWHNKPLRLWVLDVFYDRKTCFRHYAGYTLTKRMGWPPALAYPAAFIFSLYVPGLMHSMRAIPVYRNDLRRMKETLAASIDNLCAGEHVAVFPDVDYTSESNNIGQMYTGFVNLDKPYYARTGRHVAFIPLTIDEQDKRIVTGEPVYILDGESFAEGKRRVSAQLHRVFETNERNLL